MKAIETRYANCFFRSRLEARWAIFFETLGLPWEYEPEGFRFDNGVQYLPDFRVLYPGRHPGEAHHEWFEVKPALSLITPDEWRKMRQFHNTEGLVILDGPPAARVYQTVNQLYGDSWVIPESATVPSRAALTEAEKFERDGLALLSHKGRLWWDYHDDVFLPADEIARGNGSAASDWAVEKIKHAVRVACSYRFESGARR